MDSGLADPLLGSPGVSGSASDCSFLSQSTIYNWSYCHFSKPLLTATDGADEIAIKRVERENLALNHITKRQHACEQEVCN
ncbi:putative regulatory associated protein of TOR [Helianthus anomalus]